MSLIPWSTRSVNDTHFVVSHADIFKWIEKCLEVEWRVKIASLNILLTAVVWRQDHNGFTHQDPGFLDMLPTRAPRLSASTFYRMATVSSPVSYTPSPIKPEITDHCAAMDHCLRSSNYVNVVVAYKQDHLQFLTMDEAVEHCTKGAGIWSQFSTDGGEEPDVVMASCGDVPTNESLAAIDLLLQNFPELKIRCVSVVE
jgi:xylulose-5-phosphate/fructose-6-phosphate phosphoketolase